MKIVTILFALIMNSVWAKPTNELLTIGISQEFENLNPLIKQMMATTYIYGMVGRGLMWIDHNGEWKPLLLKSIPSMENGQAKFFKEKGVRKIRANFEFKENAKWGDGTPVTGHDMKFTWDVGRNKNVSVGETEIYTQIEKIIVDKKNPKKFTLVYEKAKWDFNQLGSFDILPQHMEGKVFKANENVKEGYVKNTNYVTHPTEPGLYNGPYRIGEIKLGSHVILVPNKHFYGNAPKVKKIIIKLIPNTGTLEANLRSGNIDMISIIGLSLDQALALEAKIKKDKLRFSLNYKPGLIYEHIDLQLGNPFLKNINVRKALVYAIDRNKLTKALFAGKQSPAVHNIAPIDPWYSDDPSKIVLYKTSRRKAKKLLDKAGWKVNPQDGYRYKDGKKLSFQLMTTSGNKLREMVEVYLQGEWKRVGIEITIKNEPPRVYFGETVKKSKFPAMAMFAWFSAPENTPRSTFHSESIPSKKNGWSGQNDTRWVNKEVDKIIEQIDVTFDANKRKELITKVLYHYTNEVPVIPLYYRSDISVTPINLKGYDMTGHQFVGTNRVEYWTLNK